MSDRQNTLAVLYFLNNTISNFQENKTDHGKKKGEKMIFALYFKYTVHSTMRERWKGKGKKT